MLRILGEVPHTRLRAVADVDLCLVACGYESRARAFASLYGFEESERLALAFPGQQLLSFAENERAFRARGFAIETIHDTEIVSTVSAHLGRHVGKQDSAEVRMFVDISSQSRSRLAFILEAISRVAGNATVRVFFGYTLAQYLPPPLGRVPNVGIGPVSDFFAGWSPDPELPVSLVLGLGYEPDRAMGAVEYLGAV